MKYGDNFYSFVDGSINQAVLSPKNFANRRVVKLWNYSPRVWEHREMLRSRDESLGDQTGVVR